ncbi:5-formyltetrahydrofolate cyclo-ligase [Hydra vulgaris]|uniref:5-formyltetrahydrofolate cyclo-ligase n=1 Tax=Hydra vulgaris TaxID=6087 RepID=T2MFE5_HYDVU|nr:5-formyltetrahydrofolate cyclo-ligase [Hydra vulgaris]
MSSSQRTLGSAKQLLRKELKEKLRQMSHQDKAEQSKIITTKLFSMDIYKQSKSISLYLNMPTEVFTSDILADIFKSNKVCYIPRYIGKDMDMVYLKDQDDYDKLPVTSWNIKQPNDDEKRESSLNGNGLDLVIVPGLGFTKSGFRLGRGKGYYDQYFHKYENVFLKKPTTIGLAYTCQIKESLPIDDFDVQLDYVLYP